MQRHTNGVYASATKNIAFTMKHVSTVGNYDYSFLCVHLPRLARPLPRDEVFSLVHSLHLGAARF